jgi:signal transduction histidine kinase
MVALALAHAQHGGGWGPGPPMGEPPWPPGRGDPLPIAAYAAVAVVALSVMVRRLRPRTAYAATVVAAAVLIAATGMPGPAVLAPVVVQVYTLASLLPLRAWTPWLGLVPLLVVALWLGRPAFGLSATQLYAVLGVGAAVLSVPAALGVVVRTARETDRRERRQELHRFAYEERLRIAREVHDVVGHSLSVINMQAGVALHVLHKRPDRIEPSLEAIRQTSKDALEELRGTLAVFRDPDGGRGPRAPLPGLDRLDDLVAGVASAGRTAEVRTEGAPAPLPAAVDHAAYRIVQEALTNVVRHAGGAGAAVRIEYRPAEVVVEVTDDGPARPGAVPPEGNGIAGMRERARAVGGGLTAGPRPEGGFAVRAELPRGER